MQKSTKFSINIRPAFCIWYAFLLIILPLKWIFAWAIASAFHEICHCLALKVLHCSVNSVDVGMSGALIHTDALTNKEEFLCALAGPVGALLLLLSARLYPELSICVVAQSFYNLIPLYPLDGGRAFRVLIMAMLPEAVSAKTIKYTEMALLILMIFLTLYICIKYQMGLIFLFLPISLLLRSGIIKYPCKEGRMAVQ